jgi:hypothetical protein
MTKKLLNSVALAAISLTIYAGVAKAAPNFSGPWEYDVGGAKLQGPDRTDPPLNDAGKAQLAKNQAAIGTIQDPDRRCLPPGTTRVMMQKGFPFDIVAGKRTVGFLYQWNRNYRPVYLNAKHWDGIGPEYFGQAVGHWEGNTLVVDSNSFNDTTWLDDSGLPHSDQLHMVEHYSVSPDGKSLTDQITIEDPAYYSKPWTTMLMFKKSAPGTIVQEDYCFTRLGLDRANIVSK